jgi:hypothetical protein
MTQNKKKGSRTQKSKDLDLSAILVQLLGNGAVLGQKVLGLIEGLARKRELTKSYPYLNEAFSNVKGALGFLQMSFGPQEKREVKTHERKKRTKRTKGHKKISK